MKRNVIERDEMNVRVRNCRLKADAARRAASRGLMGDLVIAARACNCFLWMAPRSAPTPADPNVWYDVAGCFDGLAMAVSLIERTLGHGRLLRQGLVLAAEAQAAARVAVEDVGLPRPDSDQVAIYKMIERIAERKHLYIPRFMGSEERADPKMWRKFGGRLVSLEETVEREEEQAKLLQKVRCHARRIQDDGSRHDWDQLIETIETLVSGGLPQSNRGLREILLPIMDAMPVEMALPPAFFRVWGEVEQFRRNQMTYPMEKKSLKAPGVIERVARLLQGKTLLVIGGSSRTHAIEAFESAFPKTTILWRATRRTESYVDLLSEVAKADVTLLMIRWVRHSYKNVQKACEERGGLFLRLPSGYNPAQVAHQLAARCPDMVA